MLPKIRKVRRPPPVSIFRFFMRFPFPIRAGGAPYASAALRQFTKNRKSAVSHPASPYAVAMPHRSPRASDPHTSNIPIPPQSDHAPAETSAPAYANQAPAGLLELPAAATACSPPPASTHDVASRRGVDAVGARVQAVPKAAPAARIPGEPGQAGPGKNPQARRRIAQDGWQITQARPGVTLAPGFAVYTLSRIS